MGELPELSEIANGPPGPDSPLAQALSTLFERSPILVDKLEPMLHASLANASLTSYVQVIDAALALICSWDIPSQSTFISGHPRIGETKNLSNLSSKEQSGGSAAAPTPPEVLARLAHLNACYEVKYPGLRYITFVNGRSRQVVAEEMEDALQIEHCLSPTEPSLSEIDVTDQDDGRWMAELQRAVYDVGRIAKSRLRTLGVN